MQKVFTTKSKMFIFTLMNWANSQNIIEVNSVYVEMSPKVSPIENHFNFSNKNKTVTSWAAYCQLVTVEL